LEEVELRNEDELEALLMGDPNQIEKDLKILDNQIRTPPTDMVIDMLCVDSKGVLTIIELKKDTDDHQMEQLVMYYDWALSNLDWIKNAYKKKKIEIIDETPRLILIAKDFPYKVTTLAKYFNEKITRVDLYTYKAVIVENKKEIICIDYNLPTVPEIFEKPKTPEDIINKITDEKVKEECNKVRNYLTEIDPSNIIEMTTRSAITFKYKSKRNICEIKPRRNNFRLGWRKIDNEWVEKNGIETFTEAKECIESLGGVLEFYEELKKIM